MIGTVEIIGSNFNKKIAILKKIVNVLSLPTAHKIVKEIRNLEINYETNTVNILVKYYIFLNSEKKTGKQFFDTKTKYMKKYQSIIIKNRFFIKAKNISNTLRLSAIPDALQNILDNLFQEFDMVPAHVDEKMLSKTTCETCNQEMSITSNVSQRICKKCGFIENMYGTVFEDEQFYYQEGHRSKHGNYETNKHFKIWVERIQARESKDIPVRIINKLMKCIENDHIIDIHRISCKLIRYYLRKIRETTFNEHVPLIRKLLNGKVPPQLNDVELRKLAIWFDKAITVFERIKPIEKTNCPYHPYFIYKILDVMITDNRKKEILACIHLQSRDTLIENDRNWKIICNRIPFFKDKYTPTNRYDNIVTY